MTGINRLSGAGVYNQNNYTKKRVVSTPVHPEYSPQKTSQKKKWAIAAGVAAVLLTGTAIILTKGKALRQKRLLSEIPADLQVRFANIKDLQGKDFVDKAYKEMVDYMGLSAKKEGKAEEFLAKIKDGALKSRVKIVKENFADVLAMPKIKADSAEGKAAYEHLKAYSNYEGIGFLGCGGDAYKNNPLEVEAYSFGNKIEELFHKYLKSV